jgi:type IV secretion system protein VirB1
MLTAATLAIVLQACAPTVDPRTQAALISVESAGNAFAILDDNNGRSYSPRNYRTAVVLAETLIDKNRKQYREHDRGIDVGITQINSLNFSHYGITPEYALDPCFNLREGSYILTTAYSQRYESLSSQHLPDGIHQQKALTQALAIYNSGSPNGDQRYIASILLAASRNVFFKVGEPLSTPSPQSSTTNKTRASIPAMSTQTARFYQRPGSQRISLTHHTSSNLHSESRPEL